MKNKSIFIITLFAAALFFTACGGSDKTEAAAEPEKQEAKHENPDESILTAEQIKTIGIEFGFIEQKQLTASLKTKRLS